MLRLFTVLALALSPLLSVTQAQAKPAEAGALQDLQDFTA